MEPTPSSLFQRSQDATDANAVGRTLRWVDEAVVLGGKAERFIQTHINDWADARLYRSNGDRLRALRRSVDFYN